MKLLEYYKMSNWGDQKHKVCTFAMGEDCGVVDKGQIFKKVIQKQTDRKMSRVTNIGIHKIKMLEINLKSFPYYHETVRQ